MKNFGELHYGELYYLATSEPVLYAQERDSSGFFTAWYSYVVLPVVLS